MKYFKNKQSLFFIALLAYGYLCEGTVWGRQEGTILITNESPDKCQIFSVYPRPFHASFKFCTEKRNIHVGASPVPVTVNKFDALNDAGKLCEYVVEEGYNFLPNNIATVTGDSTVRCFFHGVCKCYQG